MYADYALHDAAQRGVRFSFSAAAMGFNSLSFQARAFGFSDAAQEFKAAGLWLDEGSHSHEKPSFNLTSTPLGGQDGPRAAVREEKALSLPYCDLVRFARETDRHDPKILLVAPMSGHYATLLRGTVEALLPAHDVYITDWVNARDVPPAAGSFGMADYAGYIRHFLRHLGPDTHVAAVCQPVVPVLAAISLMAADGDPAQPVSMTLMGGPVDTRAAPTDVTKFAEDHSMAWFARHALSAVPLGYRAAGREVYPGFKQLTGFLAMNPDRHAASARDMFQHLRRGDDESAAKIRDFYREYCAVMDIPAQFYLETVDWVFKRHLLPKGEMVLDGQRVTPSAITKTALLTIEGERDDISAPGQTVAAHALCNNIAPRKKFHYLQQGAGHYGIFEGRRWREEISPRLSAFIRAQPVDNKLKYSPISGNSRPMPHNFGG